MNRQSFLKSLALTPLAMHLSSLNSLETWTYSLPHTEKMPVLFLGHGSPMNAIEDNQFVRGFKEILKSIPKPKAILCISAHWYIKGTQVLSSSMPKTIHDFGGFPDELYQVQYPAKGDPELAEEVKNLLGAQASLSNDWGFDHGAWSVLIHLFPKADIPVIQLSIDYSQPSAHHFELGKLLKTLRNKGILVVGSGNIVHNLGRIDWQNMNKEDYGYDRAIEVRERVNNAILNRNMNALIHYEKQGKAFQNAIPTPDHYLPLLYSLGMLDYADSLELFNDKLLAGSLSMTSLRIG
ncbi:MAG: 4,5-DOPA dioxygenase extradiol [Chitinophagales bacterium]|nr:4,5-DOPA dioxygenase extradiol [Sphingobacteriales bacterium]